MFSDVIKAKLEYCLEHIKAIEEYFKNISTEQDFRVINNGLNYDGILMRLQALTELIKRISQNHPEIIEALNYPHIQDVIKFRDYVSHHYEKLGHEIVFDICSKNIPELKDSLKNLLEKNV